MTDTVEELVNDLWDCATNAVCQEMQDRGMCKCPKDRCVAASVSPGEYENAYVLRPFQSLKKERDEAVRVLTLAEEKLTAYFADNGGKYVGGMEYSALMNLIKPILARQALEQSK